MEQRSAFHNHQGADSDGALIAVSFDEAEHVGKIHGVYSLEFSLDAIRHTLTQCVRQTDIVFEVRLGLFVVFARGATLDQGHMISQRIYNSTIDMPSNSNFDVKLRMGGVAAVKPDMFAKLLNRAQRYAEIIKNSGLTPAAHDLLTRLDEQKTPMRRAA